MDFVEVNQRLLFPGRRALSERHCNEAHRAQVVVWHIVGHLPTDSR
jgi:hypothetical protein